MNILHVIPIFNPDQPFGGSQSYVDMITRELSKRGHKIAIYTSDMKSSSQRLEAISDLDKKRRVVRYRNLSIYLTKHTRLIVTPNLLPLLEKTASRYQIIHVHGGRGFQHVAVWRAAKKACVPYIIQPHGDLAGYYSGVFRASYDRTIGKQILRQSNRIIALNAFEEKQCLQSGALKDRIRVIPNGINLEEFANLEKGKFRSSLGLDSEEKILLFLGRIHRVKGLDILLKSLSIIRQTRNDIRLVVAGPDDGDLAPCLRLSRNLGIEKSVRFIGPVFGQGKLNALTDADLYVLPSRHETFSIGLLEAYASGTAAVATAVGGNEELIVDGVTGVIAAKPEYHLFAKALLKAIPESDILGRKAKSFANNFNITKTAAKLESVYLELR
jgi:glycosyltransferase involved in cell wall biosynthesis